MVVGSYSIGYLFHDRREGERDKGREVHSEQNIPEMADPHKLFL